MSNSLYASTPSASSAPNQLISTILMPGHSGTVYFHSPDYNVSRNVLLKSTFESYLAQYITHTERPLFQPVARINAFKDLIVSSDALALFVPPNIYKDIIFHYPNLKQKFVPVLQGKRLGTTTYRKVLVGPKDKELSEGKVVASSMSKTDSLSLIRKMNPDVTLDVIESLQILNVPKDLDALMSINFGMADFALAREDSYQKLEALYLSQFRETEVVGESDGHARMVVFLNKSLIKEGKAIRSGAKSLYDLFASMSSSDDGKQALAILGLDDWQAISGASNNAGGPEFEGRDSAMDEIDVVEGGAK